MFEVKNCFIRKARSVLATTFHVVLFMFLIFPKDGICSADYSRFTDVTQESLEPFAKDMGGLLGSGTYHTARSLGFSGFDIGLRGVLQLKPDFKNKVFSSSQDIALGWLHAEIGMPYRLDGFVRAGSYGQVTLTGGGVKWGLRKISDENYYIQVMIIGLGNMAVHENFHVRHFGSSIVFSMNSKYFVPYFGVGFDNTKLVVLNAQDSSLNGKKVTTTEPRLTLGLKSKIKFGYLATAASLLHDRIAVEGSIGFRF